MTEVVFMCFMFFLVFLNFDVCADLSLATEPSVQLDLESGANCQWTSDIWTCQTAVLTVTEDS